MIVFGTEGLEVREEAPRWFVVFDWTRDSRTLEGFKVWEGSAGELPAFLLGLPDDSLTRIIFTSGLDFEGDWK